MKILERLFDNVNMEFERHRKLAWLSPLLRATEGFFLGFRESASKPPFIRDHMDLKRYMFTVIIALACPTLMGIYIYGYRVILVIVTSYVFGGLAEVIFAIVRKHEINEGFLVTGLLFPLTLPPTIPLWMVAVGVVFGVVIGKELFGGTGHNIFNPALTARCFVYLAYPVQMTTEWVRPGHNLFRFIDSTSVDALTEATPTMLAKQGVVTDLIFPFLGWVPGSIGETSAFLIIMGGIFLCLTGVANYRTMLGMIIGALTISSVFYYSGLTPTMSPLFTLFSGSILFGAVYMATDPVSSPAFNGSKWIYGLMIGGLAILIRSFSGWPAGTMFAILIMNAFAPLIDQIVILFRYREVVRQ